MNYRKIAVLLIAVPLMSNSAKAQIEKGTKFFGGGLNINRSAYTADNFISKTEDSRFNLLVSPRAGYFVSNSFAIGLGLDYSNSADNQTALNYTNNDLINRKDRTNSFGISVFGRYTKPLGKKFFCFVDGNISSGFGNFKSERTDRVNGVLTYSEFKDNVGFGNSIAVVVRPGIIYFVNPHWGIEGSYGNLNYQYANNNGGGPGSVTNSSFNLNLNSSSWQIGVNYYCKKKVKRVASEDGE